MVLPDPNNRAYSDGDTRWLRGRRNNNVFTSQHVPMTLVVTAQSKVVCFAQTVTDQRNRLRASSKQIRASVTERCSCAPARAFREAPMTIIPIQNALGVVFQPSGAQQKRGTMFKFISWHVWTAVAIAVAVLVASIFYPSPLLIIAIVFAWGVYIVAESKAGEAQGAIVH